MNWHRETLRAPFLDFPLPETFLSARKPGTRHQIRRPPGISERVRSIPDNRIGKQFDVPADGGPGISLVPGIPAVDEFPITVWERLRAQVLAKKGSHLLRNAAGDADQRDGFGKSERCRVDRRSWFSSGPQGFCFCRGDRGSKTRRPGR